MKKPARLGMGLSALMGDAAAPPSVPSGAPRTLPVEALEPSPFQARSTPDPSALAELAASIKEHGILQPILVRPKPGTAGKFQILGGERRWRAAQQAKLHDVPVVIRDLDSDTSSEEPTDGVFVLIGALPRTQWLPDTVLRDRWGYVLTGTDVLKEGPSGVWPHETPPLPLETSMRGVFAVGDVRRGSVKRVASAVGEGSVVVSSVHQRVAERAGSVAPGA